MQSHLTARQTYTIVHTTPRNICLHLNPTTLLSVTDSLTACTECTKLHAFSRKIRKKNKGTWNAFSTTQVRNQEGRSVADQCSNLQFLPRRAFLAFVAATSTLAPLLRLHLLFPSCPPMSHIQQFQHDLTKARKLGESVALRLSRSPSSMHWAVH